MRPTCLCHGSADVKGGHYYVRLINYFKIGSYYVHRVGLELVAILLLLSPHCYDHKCEPATIDRLVLLS